MSFALIRSITLSHHQVRIWKEHGAWLPRRERSTDEVLNMLSGDGNRDQKILNMGNTAFDPSDEDMEGRGLTVTNLWNKGGNIKTIVTPGSTRRLMPELLPPVPSEGKAWVKAPGSGGRGKIFKVLTEPLIVPRSWDVQAHATGQEYRVITVQNKVVQVSERHGDNGDRSYKWVGVRTAPMTVKDIARTAAKMLSGQNIIGWDIILNDSYVRILEGNSCPGVNYATAGRIVAAINGRTYNA